MRFGVHIPTCIEGMMYPVPFAKPSDILPTALLCERLGFDSVWGNDHMTTQRYVQKEFPDPPNFFEPLMTFAYCASRTTRLRFATGIIVLPMRNMPVLAKQVATLDQLSGGRVILGECFPKPVQDPMPIYAGGNHPEVRRRAGQYAQGWMPAVLSPEEIERGVADIHRAAAAAGRDGSVIDIAPQFAVSIGRTHDKAVRRFRASQLFKHLESLKRSTLREQTGGFDQRNLIGSPAEISERIRVYERAGVTTLSGMLFVASSVPEMHEAIELFGQEVLPNFRR